MVELNQNLPNGTVKPYEVLRSFENFETANKFYFDSVQGRDKEM